MPLECGAPSVSNQVIRVNSARIDRIKTKETMEGHNNKIRGRKGKISMDKVTIEVLYLNKTFKMKARRTFTIHVVGGMLRVNVGRMVKITVATTVEVVTPRWNVGNRIAVVMG